MHALMAFVCEALLAALLGLDVDEESWSRMVRAFTKLLWLQNDLTACHYAWGGA